MRPLPLVFALISFLISFAALWLFAGSNLLTLIFGLGGGLFAVLAFAPRERPKDAVLELGGLSWNEEDFCRGWQIDGRTGSGKTASAVIPIIHQLKAYRPDVGILALDTKGDLSSPLARIAEDLCRETDLVQLEVRPESAPPNWQPKFTINFLADTTVAYSTYAKVLVDVATAAGQKGGQSFFKVAAQTAIQNLFQALDLLGRPVTIPLALRTLMVPDEFAAMGKSLQELYRPEAEPLVRYFYDLIKSPPEQLGGIRSTVFNYLQPFSTPDIAAVFSPENPNFSLAQIDAGKLVSVKIPQKYQVEKKYVSLLLKVLFYLHALRRYDLALEARVGKNLIVMVLDEAQETVLVSEDGISDYNVVDKIRGARATTINSTQSPTSYIPPMGGRDNADVFLLNLGNKIHFTAADKQASEMIAESIGKRMVKKRTYGRSGGKSSTSWKEEEDYWLKPFQLRRLAKHVAIITHCERPFRQRRLAPSPFTRARLK